MVSGAAFEADPAGEAGGEHRIPKERVDAMIAKAKADAEAKAAAAEERARAEAERRQELEARIQQSAPPPPQTPEKPPLSRAELRALVDEGKLAQEEMDAELERQMEARVEQRVASKQETRSRAVQINAEIDRYMERVPDLDNPISDNRKRVQAEFQALRKRGYPNDVTTELVALRAVLGDVEKIPIPEIGNEAREVDTSTHTSGSEESSEAEGSKGPGPLKGLSKEFRDYYQQGIDAGRYKGWDDERLIRIQKRAIERGK